MSFSIDVVIFGEICFKLVFLKMCIVLCGYVVVCVCVLTVFYFFLVMENCVAFCFGFIFYVVLWRSFFMLGFGLI